MAIRLAHRGDRRLAPENTLGALLGALAIPGCDGLEFDVRIAAEGVPVVIHDASLRRVQGVPGRVTAKTAAELGRHGVPTLHDVLAAVPASAFLDVELKGLHGPATFEVLAAGRGIGGGRTVVSSFSVRTLARARRWSDGFPRWFNVEDLGPATIATAVRLGCRGLSADWRAIDARSTARVGAAGLDLAAWTVLNPATWRRLEQLGVLAMCVEGAALDGGTPAGRRR